MAIVCPTVLYHFSVPFTEENFTHQRESYSNLLEHARQYCSSTLACTHTKIDKILFVLTTNMPKMQLKNS